MKDFVINSKYQEKYFRRVLKNIARNDPDITQVVLNCCVLGDERVASLASSLINNVHIKILYLQHCGITAKQAHLLGFALRKNKSLEHLWLNGNKIGSAGAEAIAAALFENQSLMTLGLANNSIGNHGGKRLVEAMRINISITDIFLEGNRMNERVVHEIDRCCARIDGKDEDCGVENENNFICSAGTDTLEDIDSSTIAGSVSTSFARRLLDSIKEEDDNDVDEEEIKSEEDWVSGEEFSSYYAQLTLAAKKKEQESKLSKLWTLGRLLRGKKIRPSKQ